VTAGRRTAIHTSPPNRPGALLKRNGALRRGGRERPLPRWHRGWRAGGAGRGGDRPRSKARRRRTLRGHLAQRSLCGSRSTLADLLQVVPACQETRRTAWAAGLRPGYREADLPGLRRQRPAPRLATCRRSSCDALSRPPNVGNRGEYSRTRRYVPETNGVVERFNRTIGVRAPLPPRDRQPGRARRGGAAYLALYNEVRPRQTLG